MAALGSATVEVRAEIGPFSRALAQAERETRSFSGRGAAAANGMAQAFRQASGIILASMAPLATGAAVAGLIRFTDGFRQMQNALKVSGLEGANLDAVFGKLAASAQANFAPLGSLVTLYGRAAQSAKELGASQADLLSFTDNVSKALRVAGGSPEAASGALLQLSQLLGSARVQAEEFNSVNEGARPILQAVADGITEAGGSVSKLKALVTDGKVSNKAFFNGFQIGAGELDQKLAGTVTTVSGAFENLKTQLTLLAGEFDKQSGSTDIVVSGIENIGAALVNLKGYFDDLNDGFAAFDRFLFAFSQYTGLANVGRAVNQAIGTADYTQMSDDLKASQGEAATLETRLSAASAERDKLLRYQGENAAFKTTITSLSEEVDGLRMKIEALNAAKQKALGSDTTASIIAQSPVANLPPVTVGEIDKNVHAAKGAAKLGPVSLKAYPVGEDTKAAKDAETAAKRRAATIKDMIEDLSQERAVLQMSNLEREISNNLYRAGATAASAEGKQIAELTRDLAAHTKALEQQQAQRAIMKDLGSDRADIFTDRLGSQIRRMQEDAGVSADSPFGKWIEESARLTDNLDKMKEGGRDVFKGLMTDAREGVKPLQILENAVTKISDKLFEQATDNLYESLFSGVGDAFGLKGIAKPPGGRMSTGAMSVTAGVVNIGGTGLNPLGLGAGPSEMARGNSAITASSES